MIGELIYRAYRPDQELGVVEYVELSSHGIPPKNDARLAAWNTHSDYFALWPMSLLG